MDDNLSDKAKLYTKILNVQNKVEAITKDKTNTHLKYGYASEKAIKDAGDKLDAKIKEAIEDKIKNLFT